MRYLRKRNDNVNNGGVPIGVENRRPRRLRIYIVYILKHTITRAVRNRNYKLSTEPSERRTPPDDWQNVIESVRFLEVSV